MSKVLLSFLLGCAFFALIAFILRGRTLKAKFLVSSGSKAKEYKKSGNASKPDEEILQELEEFKEQKVERINERGEVIERGGDDAQWKTVGIAKPLGFWTKLVLKQKFSTIAQNMSLRNIRSGNYWRSYVVARERELGKEVNRDRGI